MATVKTMTRFIRRVAWLMGLVACGEPASESEYGTCIEHEPAPGVRTCVMSRQQVAGGDDSLRRAAERRRARYRSGADERERAERRASHTSHESVDLGPEIDAFCPPVHDQGRCGTCVAHAVTGAMEALLCTRSYGTASGDGVSVPHLWYAAKQGYGFTTPGCEEGVELGYAMGKAKNNLLVPDWLWPYPPSGDAEQIADRMAKGRPIDATLAAEGAYRIKAWSKVPDWESMSVLTKIQHAVARGYPVVYAVPVFEGTGWDWGDETYGWIVSPPESCWLEDEAYADCLEGGHAILIVGYDDDDEAFIFRNSWGSGWNEDGYGRLDYDLVWDWGLGGGYPSKLEVR